MVNVETIEIRCRKCGAKNRVSSLKLSQGMVPVCGKCKEELIVEESKGPIVVTDETFEDEVEKSSIPVLLDCWAPWCGPCKMVAPILEKIAEEWTGRLKVAKLDVDENPRIATKLDIMSIPTLLVYKDGKIVDKMIGAQPKAAIERHLQKI